MPALPARSVGVWRAQVLTTGRGLPQVWVCGTFLDAHLACCAGCLGPSEGFTHLSQPREEAHRCCLYSMESLQVRVVGISVLGHGS